MGHTVETCRNRLCRKKLTGHERFCPRCQTLRVAPVKKASGTGLALFFAFLIIAGGLALMVAWSSHRPVVTPIAQARAEVKKIPTQDNARISEVMTAVKELGGRLERIEIKGDERELPPANVTDFSQVLKAVIEAEAVKAAAEIKASEATANPVHVSPEIRVIEAPVEMRVERAVGQARTIEQAKPVESKAVEVKRPEIKAEPAKPRVGSPQNWSAVAEMVRQNRPVSVTRVRELLGDPAEALNQGRGMVKWTYRPAGASSTGTVVIERNAVKSVTVPQFGR